MEPRGNWIGGERRPAQSGLCFSPRRNAGEWARSSSADVELALAELALGAKEWGARRPSERERIVARACDLLCPEPDPAGELAAALGLDAGELPSGRGSALAPRAAAVRAGEITLVHRRGAELFEGHARTTLAELAGGRGVLIVADPRCPERADRLLAALLDAGLPPRAFAVLFDDGRTAWRSALVTGVASRVLWAASEAERVTLEPPTAPYVRGGFGAGVSSELEPALVRFEPLCSIEREIDREDDPERAARAVVRNAFGRIETFGGQRPGRVGSVRVPAERLSAFTEALLDVLERGPLAQEAPPEFLDPDLDRYLGEARDLGLDEGATLIHEGLRDASHGASGADRLTRLVFTNVEPSMRLARDLRPAPILLLERIER